MTQISLNSPDAPDYYAEYIQAREDLHDANVELEHALTKIAKIREYVGVVDMFSQPELDWDKIDFVLATHGISFEDVLRYVRMVTRNEIAKNIGEIINE
jgi:DNA polymerase II small subunit/DNA polymerase delta subunit B